MSDPVRDLLVEVIDRWKGHVGTHYPTCYLSHPPCLAVLVLDLLDEP